MKESSKFFVHLQVIRAHINDLSPFDKKAMLSIICTILLLFLNIKIFVGKYLDIEPNEENA